MRRFHTCSPQCARILWASSLIKSNENHNKNPQTADRISVPTEKKEMVISGDAERGGDRLKGGSNMSVVSVHGCVGRVDGRFKGERGV